MKQFTPIAIVGQACVLPGARSAEQLWDTVFNGRSQISAVDEQRWRAPVSQVIGPGADQALHDRGGYVRNFYQDWQPEGFAISPEALEGYDQLSHWVIHCARQALLGVKHSRASTGAVLGNLGFPSEAMSRFAESVWRAEPQAAPHSARARHMSGGTSELLQRALGLGGASYCLDAACASSLYALKLACDQLAAGSADCMLAGAVQRADDLFLHIGFSALKALSPSAQSRPFHAQADGLVPAEGAVMFVLKRLIDARQDGDPILGVIRGIGLSNDGRGKGLLVPDQDGQLRAMRRAYACANVSPAELDLLECHATGTSVGDAVEIASTTALLDAFEVKRKQRLPIGSLKSNLGHLITAAGGAALMKVLSAMQQKTLPRSLHCEQEHPAITGSPFRVLHDNEAWTTSDDRPRIAGISAFGFGGNNAHLIVSEDHESIAATSSSDQIETEQQPLAIIAHRSLTPEQLQHIPLDQSLLRIPPLTLQRCLPQQLAVLSLTQQLLHEFTVGGHPLPEPEATAVLIGMEPDPEVARYGLRWRLAHAPAAMAASPETLNAIVPALDSAAVLGAMPNIPANRISSQFNFGAASLTVQMLENSGLAALGIAALQLQREEISMALVAAVDFCAEPVQSAAHHLLQHESEQRDAACMLAIMRSSDARARGLPVLAQLLPDRSDGSVVSRFANQFGAASGLQALIAKLDPLQSHSEARQALIEVPGLGKIDVASAPPARGLSKLFCLAAKDRSDLLAQLRAFDLHDGHTSIHPKMLNNSDFFSAALPCRLVICAQCAELPLLIERALQHLEHGAPTGTQIYVREQPVAGKVAFAFAGAGASYPEMGQTLLQDLPELAHRLRAEAPVLCQSLERAWQPNFVDADPSAQLCAASALSQMHLALSENWLGLRADVWLGYSSGETNALFASGVWKDPDRLMQEMEQSGLMRRELAGKFAAIARSWGPNIVFESWTLLVSPAQLQRVFTTHSEQLSRVRLCIIESDEQCLIAGDQQQCQWLIVQVGENRALRLNYSLAVHMKEVRAVASAWRAVHQRATHPIRHGTLYSSAHGQAYQPSEVSCAQAILDQAVDTLDMRKVIERAYSDGVRIFVEHGPGSSFSRAIRTQLRERDALIVSLDRKHQGVDGVAQLAAQLMSAGIPIDLSKLSAKIALEAVDLQSHSKAAFQAAQSSSTDCAFLQYRFRETSSTPNMIYLPGHWPAVRVQNTGLTDVEIMRPAPSLPPPQFRPKLETSHQPARNLGKPAPALPREVSATALHGMAQQLAQLAALQQQHVQLQAQTHKRFLQHRQQAIGTLLFAVPLPRDCSRQTGSTAVTGIESTPPPRPRADAVESAREPLTPSLSKQSLLREPIGLTLSRAQLETHANGDISNIYGPEFAFQAQFTRQVRMPKPPLLLADRVVGLDAAPRSMGKGTIWTETDVQPGSWYLHQNHLPAGVMIEAGQADLMLISYLGIDAFNRSERIYRLLGCELTYHGNLARVGERIRFEISLDGHAAQGDVRLMFFHYLSVNFGSDGTGAQERPQLSVREGQAGFFTDQELADSAGCLWTPETQAIIEQPRLDPPRGVAPSTSFTRQQLEAMAAGRVWECFGDAYRFAKTHSRTPTIAGGKLVLFDRITELTVQGGPWQRGYLRAELAIDPSQWFFDGHFKNDPCMPGTLMFEACLQGMAFYLAAMGFTLHRDGWRFQPVPELPYKLQCRGQVTPNSKLLVTEIFVEECMEGDQPTLFADLLCTVDGLKAFHARRVGVQLVPDWPFLGRDAIAPEEFTRPVATADGFRFDRRAVLACADGRPSEAFGPMYQRFDSHQRVARLPSEPYHFISRIAELDGPIGIMRAGARVVAEYDIPEAAWYFSANGSGAMPFAVLLEAALQPCGWLASYVGSALTQACELCFRNLDGEGTLLGEVFPGSGTLRTEVKLTAVSASSGMIIQNFEVACVLHSGAKTCAIYRLKTVFGFFPEQALAQQAGLPRRESQQQLRGERCSPLLSFDRQSAHCTVPGTANQTNPSISTPVKSIASVQGMLRMIDAVEACWLDGGALGLGAVRAVKHIDAGEWFFKAHFFQDPVQPGSLGLEAMVHSLMYLMQALELHHEFTAPRFEALALNHTHRWKYRGQVLPKHQTVHTTVEITERGRDAAGVYALATASLWVDGARIYEAQNFGLRIVEAC